MGSKSLSRAVAIGVDLGGTFVKLAAVDRAGRVLAREVLKTPRKAGPSILIPRIAEKAAALFTAAKGARPAGVGVGAPGLVDFERGRIHTLVNISGWSGTPLQSRLERLLKVPVRVDNDVNVMALGELYFGAARGVRNALCVTLGTGVGGGLILNGRLYRGVSFSAGEVGHIPINERGPACNCGGIGCLERYVGNRYALAEARGRLAKAARGILWRRIGGDVRNLTLEELTRAARRGDRFACNFWRSLGGRIGTALSGFVNVFNPERIVVGGGMAQAGAPLFEGIRRTIRKRAMSVPARAVRVAQAKLGVDAGVVGAASLVLFGERRNL